MMISSDISLKKNFGKQMNDNKIVERVSFFLSSLFFLSFFLDDV